MADVNGHKHDEQEFNPDIYTLVDEEGVEQTFELLDVMDLEDDRYFALVPYFENPEMDENGEELMVTIDDEDEYQRVGHIFLEKLSSMFEEDEE